MKRIWTWMFVFGLVACGGSMREVRFGEKPNDAYPLDDESRKMAGGKCPLVQTVPYEGAVVPYHKPVHVNPFFRERLIQFEQVVYDTAIEVFDEPPVSIQHFGAHNCRKIRGKNKMSEHGLANAIDVSGFNFRDFKIVVKRDWHGDGDTRRFLHLLALRLTERPDIFRGMLAPDAAGHADHFHLDAGRYRYARFNVDRDLLED